MQCFTYNEELLKIDNNITSFWQLLADKNKLCLICRYPVGQYYGKRSGELDYADDFNTVYDDGESREWR